MNAPGYEALWLWFGLGRSSFCVLPRSFMHEMPDDWQRRMAALLNEWDEAWNWPDNMPSPSVQARRGRAFAKWPDVVTQYRHPLTDEIRAMKRRSAPEARVHPATGAVGNGDHSGGQS